MENINYQTVTLKPEKAERKIIHRQYMKTALVILINVLLFNIVLSFLSVLLCGLAGGSFSSLRELWNNGTKVLENDDINTVRSCLIPNISEVVSILNGVKLI